MQKVGQNQHIKTKFNKSIFPYTFIRKHLNDLMHLRSNSEQLQL